MNDPGTHKLTEALQGQIPDPADASGTAGTTGPNPTPEDVAEQTRRAQQARLDGVEDRDAKLTQIGRGQQTHG